MIDSAGPALDRIDGPITLAVRPIVIPCLRTAVRHAVPNVVHGKLVPLVVFLVALRYVGTVPALLAALAWSAGLVVVRRRRGQVVPGLVVLGVATLTARTVAAVATGSMVVYFVQPTITTAFVGCAFLASVLLGNPLAQRLARDFLPFDDDTVAHPLVEQFFVRLSLLWAFTSLVNAAVTLWLLLTQSTTTFVLVKSLLGPTTAMVTVATMLIWLRSRIARAGVPVRWASAVAVARPELDV